VRTSRRLAIAVLTTLTMVGAGIPAAGAASGDEVTAASTRAIAVAGGVVAQGIQISQAAFPAPLSASIAVISRDDLFADSLAGAPLAGSDGPILFTRAGAALDPTVAVELRRAVRPGGTVYVLGGPVAVSTAAEAAIRALGFDVQRLAGANRFETAVAIATTVDPSPGRVLLARADDWADAVTGGAYAAHQGVPVVLTNRDALHPTASAYTRGAGEVVLLGGEAALGRPIAQALGSRAQRVAGDDRAATAVEIAKRLWQRTRPGDADHFVAVEGRGAASWAPALAAGVLSAQRSAPQLLVLDGHRVLPLATHGFLRNLDYRPGHRASATAVGPLIGDDHRRLLGAVLENGSGLATVPATPGRLGSDGLKDGDGVKIFARYASQDSHYVGYVNTRDEVARIYRKHGGGERDADYDTFGGCKTGGYRTPWGAAQRATLSAVDGPGSTVTLRLFVDGQLRCEVTDRNGITGTNGLHAGIRADNTEFQLDDFEVHAADSQGRATATRHFLDRFSYPDGLLTNQRDRSAPSSHWTVTSGSLFSRGGRAVSQGPRQFVDDVYPDPESSYGNGTAKFRMHTNRRFTGNVAVSVTVWNMGYVLPSTVLSQPPQPSSPRFPDGPHPAAATRRLQGRSAAHRAIEVSKQAFASAPAVVLMDSSASAASLAAPGLAGRVGGPVLLTGSSSLHADTAAEIRRLRAREAWIVGPLSRNLDSQLQASGITRIRRLAGANPVETAALTAERVGGRHVYLADQKNWTYATGISGASARLRRPVLLTSGSGVPAATERALRQLGATHITVLWYGNGQNTDFRPTAVDQLRERYTVTYAGFSRYSISRVSAEHQTAGGANPARVWLAAGSRPTDVLVAGPAAAKEGGVLVSLDGANPADVTGPRYGHHGYESQHWMRYQRPKLRTLRAVSEPAALTDSVVSRFTAR
jgi:putative cell wall-binding protein